MPCLYPQTVGFLADGKTLTFDEDKINPEYAPFKLPCSKCIECRLDYAKEWALRAVKEAQMHEDSCFITLTYNDENLGNNKLDYKDFQEFVQKLRDHILIQKVPNWTSMTNQQKKIFRKENKDVFEKIRISVLSTGEYGTQSKRKHFHALIFGFKPPDLVYYKSNPNGDKIYQSDFLNAIWGKGFTTVGDVTLESASYTARYSLKSLEHGYDQLHPYRPISKKSNKNAIGKKWIEKYYKNVFDLNYVEHEGVKHPIPRYFKKWLKKHHFDYWVKWYTGINYTRQDHIKKIEEKNLREESLINEKRRKRGKGFQITENQRKEIIATQKQNRAKEFNTF